MIPDVTPAGQNRTTGTLAELALLFLRLGTTAFGGPAAHIAIMEDEVVRRRRWLTREQFLDYLGATNLIPGPNSTELAIHIGHARGGWPGLVVAGACFILPAMLIVGTLAMIYVRFGTVPEVGAILYAIKPVVIAVVAQALWGLAHTAIKGPLLAGLAIAAAIAAAAGVGELTILAACGAVMILAQAGGLRTTVLFAALSAQSVWAAALVPAAAPFGLWRLFLAFAKIGSVLFGSGYVLLAFMRAEFVERLGWLTEQQLLDAVAIGQVTPGPVFTTATFAGVILGGATGGIVATLGIFLPAFVFVALSGPLVPRIRRSRLAGAALDGVNAASLALMAVVSIQLGFAALFDPVTIGIGAVSLLLLVRYRVNSAWLITAAAAIGIATRWL